MCGRYLLLSPGELLVDAFHLATMPVFAPRFNVAPTQSALVVRSEAPGLRGAASLRWGLLPPWAEDGSIAARMINARSETVGERPAFREAFAARRCVIPADGFYEWTGPPRARQPHVIQAQGGGLLAFAGLWESWTGGVDKLPWAIGPDDHVSDDGATTVETFTILTTRPNAEVARLHDRMPVVLEGHAIDTWLDASAAPDDLRALCAPVADGTLTTRPVSRRVNDVRHDDEHCLDDPEPHGEPGLFDHLD